MDDTPPIDEVPDPEPAAEDAWAWTDEPKDPDYAGPPAEFVDDPQPVSEAPEPTEGVDEGTVT